MDRNDYGPGMGMGRRKSLKTADTAAIAAAVLLSVFMGGCSMPWASDGQGADPAAMEGDFSGQEILAGQSDAYQGNTAISDSQPLEAWELPHDHIRLTVSESGYDAFIPSVGADSAYRYGPAIIWNDDGSMDAWFSAPADGTQEYDWITYRHSPDGGNTWEDERAALCPTPGTLDQLSVCDPEVFFHDGYYYMGYTSTINDMNKGLCNSVFLARSRQPDRGFEKWNGHGWGGDPYPIIYYDGPGMGWGIGEPSFVIKDNTLFVYTTKDSYSIIYTRIKVTQVWSADLTEADWPAKLEYVGDTVDRSDTAAEAEAEYVYSDCDSWDVAYIEEADMFVAVCSNRRFSNNSCLLYYESVDGVHFDRVSELNTNVICGCHNSGLMSDEQGHVGKGDPMMIGYAYAGSGSSRWGVWPTRFAPVSWELVKEVDRSEDKASNLKKLAPSRWIGMGTTQLMINSDTLMYTARSETQGVNMRFYCMDSDHGTHYVDNSEVKFSGYDKNIVSVSGNGTIDFLEPGKTIMNINYRGFRRQICLCSLESGVSLKGMRSTEMTDLQCPVSTYNIDLRSPYAVAIRPVAGFANYSLKELNGVSGSASSSMAVSFDVEDESVCEIREDHVIIPISTGTTMVTVRCASGLYCRVRVNIGV